MRVVITGTPGTGKTTATERLETSLRVIHLNEVIEENGFVTGTDEERGSWIADLEAVREWYAELDDVVIESHLAHHLSADRVIVLRCHPRVLERRLIKRGEPEEKARENADSEALDLIVSEAVAMHDRECIFEIDTGAEPPAAVATEISAVISGNRSPRVGTVSFSEYFHDA